MLIFRWRCENAETVHKEISSVRAASLSGSCTCSTYILSILFVKGYRNVYLCFFYRSVCEKKLRFILNVVIFLSAKLSTIV